MKRIFTYLLLFVLLVCGKQTYNLLISNEPIRGSPIGTPSDITDEVITISLQDPGAHSIKEAKYVCQEGDNLFLISNETFHYSNRKGEFICCTTHPDNIWVMGYIVNSANQQLIILGNMDDIFYYSFNGDLLIRRKLKYDLPESRHMLSISMHNNRIFTAEECAHRDTTEQTTTIEKQIVEYDSSFHKLQFHTIRLVDLEHSVCPIDCLAPEVVVEPGNGTAYTYAPSYQPGNLLRDTSYIKQKRQGQALENLAGKNTLSSLPTRIGSRFWVSIYYDAKDESRNYTFCYDTEKEEYWRVKERLENNSYQTGNVQRMDPTDPYYHPHCFSKSGEDLRNIFPAQAQGESLVLLIVRLKG